MLLKDSLTIAAPIDAVWAVLDDVPRVSGCVPGVDGVTESGPDTYRGALKVKVGPIIASFEGTVRFTGRVPRERLVAEVEGQDKSSASLVKATFTGMLSAVEAGTRIDYEVDVALRGRLAQFGVTVVQATARKMTAQFARCLEELIVQESSVD